MADSDTFLPIEVIEREVIRYYEEESRGYRMEYFQLEGDQPFGMPLEHIL